MSIIYYYFPRRHFILSVLSQNATECWFSVWHVTACAFRYFRCPSLCFTLLFITISIIQYPHYSTVQEAGEGQHSLGSLAAEAEGPGWTDHQKQFWRLRCLPSWWLVSPRVVCSRYMPFADQPIVYLLSTRTSTWIHPSLDTNIGRPSFYPFTTSRPSHGSAWGGFILPPSSKRLGHQWVVIGFTNALHADCLACPGSLS